MAVNLYYISPYQTVYRLGGGRFSETDPGTGIGPSSGSRILLYGTWDRNLTGHFLQTVIPASARGPAKNTCLNYVSAPDVDPLLLHASIQADTSIRLVPWTPATLDQTFGTLSAAEQSAVRSALASVFMPDAWITGSTTFRSIMAFFLLMLFASQDLGADYPEGPITRRWNGLSAEQQAGINALLAAYGLPVFSAGNPAVSEVVTRLAQIDRGPGRRPILGGIEFENWSP